MEQISIGSFELESGIVLPEVQLSFERAGKLFGPVILLCHALTGDARAVGSADAPGWWGGLVGPGKAVDTDRFQAITFNVLGGSDGSTGPASIDPRTQAPYRTSFPELTIRDMVNAQKKALQLLGIGRITAVIGGSLGGMQALEWGRLFPEVVDVVMPLAVTPSYSAYGVAFNHIGIEAIRNDPDYRNGFYAPGAVLRGFEIARMAGLVTYRSGELFHSRFGREEGEQGFDIQSYLDYQGKKLASRFDPNSYITLLKAMNTHDLGDKKLDVPIFSLLFTQDLLYPKEPMIDWLEGQPQADWTVIETVYGHDGFLVEFDKWGYLIGQKLEQVLADQAIPASR